MSVSVVKSGPYFSSGSISFASLRNTFKETSSGPISASELIRNTDTAEANPIVPDSTENENIASSKSNLRISQFRNSVKRYTATQSGTDDNSVYTSDPGFRMGRYDSNGRGIDWSGGGVNGRDGNNGGFTGNLTKNIQKFININGVCGSVQPGLPGAQMAPGGGIVVHNARITVNGTIMGCGGRGGGTSGAPSISGESGSSGLNFGSAGNNNSVTISSSGKVYGGGGGGERGNDGAKGQDGECKFTLTTASSCNSVPNCPSGYTRTGYNRVGSCNQRQVCTGPFFRRRCSKVSDPVYASTCEKREKRSGGAGGTGGLGGDGRGYNNQGGDLVGGLGLPGKAPAQGTVQTSNFQYNWTRDNDNAYLNITGSGGQGYVLVQLKLYVNDNPNTYGKSFQKINIYDPGGVRFAEFDFPSGGEPQGSRTRNFYGKAGQYRIERIADGGNSKSVVTFTEDGITKIKFRDADGDDANGKLWVSQFEQTQINTTTCSGGVTITEAKNGKDGEFGGSGGDWGQNGSGTNNSGDGGNGGKSISGSGYTVNNNGSVKGSIY